jgi:hypothetical protein
MSPRRSEGAEPDIEIGAVAKARKLRFRSKPESDVEFRGGTRYRTEDGVEELDLETDEQSERRNLPSEVEPGVTYRNVEVGWAAKARVRTPDEEDES